MSGLVYTSNLNILDTKTTMDNRKKKSDDPPPTSVRLLDSLKIFVFFLVEARTIAIESEM